MGTPAYMAPEQITGIAVDARVDVYAAGVMLYELIADQRPFSHTRRSELLRAHLFEAVPRFADLDEPVVVDDAFETVLLMAPREGPR